MLPPFIIEQIRQREEQAKRDRQAEQPRLELPMDIPRPDPAGHDDEIERGVVVVDLG